MDLAFKKFSAVLMLVAPAMMLAACGSSSGSTQAAAAPSTAVTTPGSSTTPALRPRRPRRYDHALPPLPPPPPPSPPLPPHDGSRRQAPRPRRSTTPPNNSTPPVASSIGPLGPSPSLSGDTSRANNSTFVLGETVGLNFKATGLTAGIVTTLAIKVVDEFGSEVATASQSLSADSLGNATVVYSPPASKYGYYRVDASLPDGTTLTRLGTRPAGFITYAVVPDPASRQNYGDSGTRFGMQGGFSSAMGPVMSYLGVRYLLAGPGWDALEPHQAGQFATAHSEAVANGQKYPTSIVNNYAAWPTYALPLITTGEIPAWAMNAGTGLRCGHIWAR